MASNDERVEMLQLMIEGIDSFEIDTRDSCARESPIRMTQCVI